LQYHGANRILLRAIRQSRVAPFAIRDLLVRKHGFPAHRLIRNDARVVQNAALDFAQLARVRQRGESTNLVAERGPLVILNRNRIVSAELTSVAILDLATVPVLIDGHDFEAVIYLVCQCAHAGDALCLSSDSKINKWESVEIKRLQVLARRA
jgi:hypothetical protein